MDLRSQAESFSTARFTDRIRSLLRTRFLSDGRAVSHLIRERHRTTSGIYLAGDLGATLAAFFAAWILRFRVEIIPVTKNVPEFGPYLRLLPFVR